MDGDGDLGKLNRSMNKQRRVLGEVQLEVNMSALSLQRSTTSLKRLSEVLSDQRCLKEQFNATAQQVLKRDQRIEELKNSLTARNAVLEKLEVEKGKLLGEMKQLSLEKEQLNVSLQEELDVRKMIQVETHKLIADIKSSYEHKVSKLKDEIKTKEEIVSIKEKLIKDFEKLVKKLRDDIISLNEELHKARTFEKENQGRMTQSFRGSISMLESQLSLKSSEVESQINSLKFKHAEKIANKTREFEAATDELRHLLEDKEEELQNMLGRLKESRQSRDKADSEKREAEFQYNTAISELQEKLDEALEENALLQKNLSSENNDKVKVAQLELCLQQLAKQNDDLKDELEDLQKERTNNEENFKHLEDCVRRLEGNILELEAQKQELYEKTQECLRQNEGNANSSAAVKLLQEQLEQSQLKLDEVKENLIAERHRSQKFSDQLAEMEKSYGLSKVDVRILTREKATLEQRVRFKVEEIKKLQETLENVQASQSESEKKVQELTKSVSESQSKCEKESFNLEQVRRTLEEAREEKARLQSVLQDIKKEMETVKNELHSFDELKLGMKNYDKIVKEKDDEIKKKSRKIESLQSNVGILVETSSAVETQLREFELVLQEKFQELEDSEQAKTKLTSECSSLREKLQKAMTDLNEANTFKAFFERRLKEVESTMKRNDEQSSCTVSSMSSKTEELLSKNAELLADRNKFAAETAKMTAEKEYLKTRVDEVNQDNYRLTKELHNCTDMLFELKHETIILNRQVKEIESRHEARIADLRKLQTTAIQAKDASNIQMQCTISQQTKLIQFLQDQNEALKLNKKKKFVFFSRGDKDCGYQTPSKKGITLPRTMQTPSSSSATPTPKSIRPFGINARQESALVLGKCKDGDLKELEALNKQVLTTRADTPEDRTTSSDGLQITKNLILRDTKQRIDINCALHLSEDLYMFGCDQGLFSRKGETQDVHVVKIGGIGSVFQMEFISSLNSVLFLEGDDRKLMLASMGIVRSCAEAAECSQPKMSGAVVADLRDCHLFEIRDVNQSDITLCVTTQKYIHLLSWKDSIFVLRKKIPIKEVVTCMVMTPNSVIYGSDKVYELDTKNFEQHEFFDETDRSLLFVLYGGGDLTIPMAILDVGMSNWTPERESSPEFLVCFPTMGIFMDEDGHRTRVEDIVWTRYPTSIHFRHPNLFILHHSSVDIICLNAESYTKTRIGLNLDTENVGKEVATIPSTLYLQLPTPQFVGKGPQTGSIVLTSKDKTDTEVYEIYLDVANEPCPKEAMNNARTKPNPSTSASPQSSISSFEDESESQLDSDVINPIAY